MPNQIVLTRKEAKKLLLALNASNQFLDLIHGDLRASYSPAAAHVHYRLNETGGDIISLSFYKEYLEAVRLLEWFAGLKRQLQDPDYTVDQFNNLRIKLSAT